MSEAHFRAMVDLAPVGMFYIDVAGQWVYRNNTLAKLLALRSFETLDEASYHFNLIHPDDRQCFIDAYHRATAQRVALQMELRYVLPDGSVMWMLERAIPDLDAAGEIRSWTGSVTDISARKRAEARSERERQLILHISNGLGSVSGVRFFDTLCAEMSAALRADMAFIREYLEIPRPHMRSLAGLLRGESMPPLSYLIEPDDVERLRSTMRPLVVPDLSQSPVRQRTLFGEGMHALIAIPLLSSDRRLLGFMGLMHSRELDMELATRLVEIFSVRAATELERERSQRVLAEQRENLRWINELSVRIHDCTSIQQIGDEAVRAIASHISGPVVSVSVIDDANPAEVVSIAGTWDDRSRHGRFPRSGPLFDMAYANDSVLVVNNIEIQFADVPEFIEWGRAFGIVEMVSMVLHHGGRELGIVVLEYSERGYVDRLDREILRALGKMLSLAISNARHFADLEYRATHDPLTDLYSRNVLHHLFAPMVADAAGAFLLLLDLDRFKEVNDTLGHHTGDDLLRQIATRLKQRLAPLQTVLCRLGGDEFAILVRSDTDSSAHAMAFGRELLAALQRPFLVNDVQLEIGASIGAALYPEHGQDSHELLRSADVAMYAAKTRHQGVALYDAQLDMHSPERLRLIADLGSGIRERELVLHYQPKLDLRRGIVVGCEALVRWQHPRRGLLGPDHFIALAEMSDIIHELTAFVIEEACRQLSRWREQGLNLSIAVNLSARNLIDDRIVVQIERVIENYLLPPGALELEITETTLMHDPARAVALLERIAALGVRLSVDDFGTGYSSLAYLRRLPIHTLKIDRAFISEMHDKPQDVVIVQSIISLGHNLGLEVVAEGVEDRSALDTLIVLGCDQVQGYYLSRPLPAEQMLSWMQNFRPLAADA